MDNLEKEYEVIKKKLDKIIEEGDYLLAQHEIIKSYLNINEEIANLSQQLEVITKKINFNKWNSCNHMWFITKRSFDQGPFLLIREKEEVMIIVVVLNAIFLMKSLRNMNKGVKMYLRILKKRKCLNFYKSIMELNIKD